MDIRTLTPTFAVAPQITPEDCAALAAEGFTDLICNRPDPEIGPEIGSDAMRAAAEAAGLTFHLNPVHNGAMTVENVVQQGAVAEAAAGKVLAYCRSGTRSCIVWALSRAGQMPADEIIAAAAAGGYDLAHMQGQLQTPVT